MTRIICVASVVYFKIRFFFEIYYHENSNFPFAAGLLGSIFPSSETLITFILVNLTGFPVSEHWDDKKRSTGMTRRTFYHVTSAHDQIFLFDPRMADYASSNFNNIYI
ncbi:hypothetical protein IYZ83_002775 [Wolbachia pipientis]|uniref:hypothetical protein n=1 Tax=Wolbachia pipientis TaxID=955 RepID=UPI001BDA2CEE|nr:hypothetical protein [Wolbachia pipientis]UIP92121.1 hypothetical protein IYZ83_002775 [Wolbachia pipientis]